MTPTLQDLMRDATRLTQAGDLRAATQAIQRALAGFGGAATPVPATAHGMVIDVQAVDVTDRPAAAPPAAEPAAPRAAPRAASQTAPHTAPHAAPHTAPRAAAQPASAGFSSGSHSHAGLTRQYKLFLPTLAAPATGQSLPLVVMLHGCTQNPDDFAAGTGMNAAAQAQGFAVLYPAQAQDANTQRCWNWFKHSHQQRGRGEAALIAGMVQAVVAANGLDAERVCIAGLSAGGAMAALVATAYPELFAAVGVHSGLAPGAAGNLQQGLAAMRGGAPGPLPGKLTVPLIVFHGDQDATVHPRNGEQLLAAAAAAGMAGQREVSQGVSAGGQRYTRTVVHASVSSGSSASADSSCSADSNAPHLAEHWLVRGAGHAWAGGQAAGTYTDARGPDATAEMLRFFFGHSRTRTR